MQENKKVHYNTCHFILIATASKVKSELPSINIKSSATGTFVYAFGHLQKGHEKKREGKEWFKKKSINSRYNQGNHIMQAFQLLLRLFLRLAVLALGGLL